MSNEIEITNLLLAALLETGGASVISVVPKTRYSTVVLDVSHFNKNALSEKVLRLSRVIERAEDPEELKHIFSASMLGEMEDRYVRLKRRIVMERSSKC